MSNTIFEIEDWLGGNLNDASFDWMGLTRLLRSTITTEIAETEKRAQRQMLKQIQVLIAEECNTARQEGQPTSRLTSLANKIYSTVKDENLAHN